MRFARTAALVGVGLLWWALGPLVLVLAAGSLWFRPVRAWLLPARRVTAIWVAAVLVPFVLLYQGWTYWVFRKRVFATHIPDHVGLTFARPAVPVGAPTSPTGRSAGSDGAPQA